MVAKIIKIGAPWCSPCRILDKELEKITSVPIIKYDADDDPEICTEYNIRNIPVLIFLDESNNEVHRIIGSTTASKIESIISNLNG